MDSSACLRQSAYNLHMPFLGSPRARTVAWLAAGAFVISAALAALQAFNTNKIPYLTPQSTGDILVFTAMSVIVFLLLMMLLVMLIRNILKLFVDQRSRALGSRLRTRMVIGAALIALAPAAFMFYFSFQLLNRSVDRWFSQPTSELRENSTRVVLELAHYASSNARLEAEAIAASGAVDKDVAAANAEIHSRRITLEGGFVAVYAPGEQGAKQGVLGYQLPAESTHRSLLPWVDDVKAQTVPLSGPVYADLLMMAQRSDEPILVVDSGPGSDAGKREYAVGLGATPAGRLVVVGLPMPQGLSETASQIRIGAIEYWSLFRSRNSIRTTYFFMLLLITTLIFFSSMWLALFLSKQITRPVEALADAMDEIADGKLDKRVSVESSGEMAELVSAFNHMAQDLETSRHMAESSRQQLSAANRALDERRLELETILETIPSGVVTLHRDGTVLLANRAFAALMGHREETSLSGQRIVEIFPADCSEDLSRVIRRSYRMGAASTEFEIHVQGRAAHVAVTSARLELGLGSNMQGAVLVVEDTTELLRAQRQLAWKEVAQRVAHEIKNPLTPIALSAERIRKHLDRPTEESPSVIRKCSEVILGCVGTLRTLVDQFAALAQFPAPQPRACDMNKITEDALLLFSGRLEGITLRTTLEPGLPPVMADPDAVKRALANLIDNAAEAMQNSLLKVLTVESYLSEDSLSVEVAVSDTGHGLTEEIRERLFLPFYSTKQRGTGLGLSIAAKIAQEHHGSIRAEANSPKGARFLLCLPVIEGAVDSNRPVISESETPHAISSLLR
jgi:two-component system nitrogen regulation sensor histidine kinase NtrY